MRYLLLLSLVLVGSLRAEEKDLSVTAQKLSLRSIEFKEENQMVSLSLRLQQACVISEWCFGPGTWAEKAFQGMREPVQLFPAARYPKQWLAEQWLQDAKFNKAVDAKAKVENNRVLVWADAAGHLRALVEGVEFVSKEPIASEERREPPMVKDFNNR